MESDVRFFRRRANEELAAADRAVTEAARQRRLILAEAFLKRLQTVETAATRPEYYMPMATKQPVLLRWPPTA